MADPILKTYLSQVVRHFELAAVHLANRQAVVGAGPRHAEVTAADRNETLLPWDFTAAAK